MQDYFGLYKPRVYDGDFVAAILDERRRVVPFKSVLQFLQRLAAKYLKRSASGVDLQWGLLINLIPYSATFDESRWFIG